jgi:hypothetical protein
LAALELYFRLGSRLLILDNLIMRHPHGNEADTKGFPMTRLRIFTAALGFSILLSACGNTDSGKDGKQKPADQSKPDDQKTKKDGDNKHTHEPS